MALTGALFLIAYLIGLVLAFVRHPTYGLYTYIAVFYLHPPSRWWGAFLPDLRWSLVAAVLTLVATWRLPGEKNRPVWYSTAPAKILIAFTIWLWIQSFWALDPEMHLEASILFTKYVVLFFLIYRLIQTPDQFQLFLLVHVAGCFYLGWLGYITPVSGRLEGVGGPGIDEANGLAMHLGTAVMIGSMLILAERKWKLWFCVAAMPFILNTIVLAGSRGAFLSLLGSGLVLWYLKPEVHRRLFYGLASLGLVLFLMLAHEVFWERMGSMKAAVGEPEELDTSAESRLVLIKAQWQMAKQYPFGTGHRGTEVLSPMYLDERYMSAAPGGSDQVRHRSSHNTFMTALVEQGLPGAFLFSIMWIWCARTLRRLKSVGKAWSPNMTARVAGIGGALAVVFIAGMFVDYLKAEVQTWLWALLASASCLASQAGSGSDEGGSKSQSSATTTAQRLPARLAPPVRKSGR